MGIERIGIGVWYVRGKKKPLEIRSRVQETSGKSSHVLAPTRDIVVRPGVVRVVVEDILTEIPAIDDVIDRTGIFEAPLARHERKLVSTSRTVNRDD